MKKKNEETMKMKTEFLKSIIPSVLTWAQRRTELMF